VTYKNKQTHPKQEHKDKKIKGEKKEIHGKLPKKEKPERPEMPFILWMKLF